MVLLSAVQRYFRPPQGRFGLSCCLVCPPPFFPEEGPGRVVSALVQRGSRGDVRGQQVSRVPERSEEEHTLTAGLPGQHGRRQRQHSAALQRVALQLRHRQPATGHR